MRYNNAEIIHSSENDLMYDSNGTVVLAYSDALYVEEYVEIKSFTVNPTETTTKSSVKASVKPEEGIREGTM